MEKAPAVPEPPKPASKEEVKATEEAFMKMPKVGEPANTQIFPGLSGVSEPIVILSFLHYQDLIKLAKTSRAAYNFVMDMQARKRILHWKPDKEEETRINNYILNLIQAIDNKE